MKIKRKDAFYGEFLIPGDKSITHRAIMFNAAAEGSAVVKTRFWEKIAFRRSGACARWAPRSA